jgi:hypothetical protein
MAYGHQIDIEETTGQSTLTEGAEFQAAANLPDKAAAFGR